VKTTSDEHDAVFETLIPYLQENMRAPKEVILLGGDVREAGERIAGRMQTWDGIVEMIICSQAHAFVGSWGSTYTGYIQRLRGYMPEVMDKRMLFFDSEKDDGISFPTWKKHYEGWAREWSEAFGSF